MFINDKKTLSKAIYVCLTVSSLVVTNDGYGMHDEYSKPSSKKRSLPSEFGAPAAKRQKKSPDQAMFFDSQSFLQKRSYASKRIEKKPTEARKFNKQLQDAEKTIRPIGYAFEDLYDGVSKTVERNIITPMNDLNKPVNGAEKTIRSISYACEDLYDNVSKTVERNIITPMNDAIKYDDTCFCTLF